MGLILLQIHFECMEAILKFQFLLKHQKSIVSGHCLLGWRPWNWGANGFLFVELSCSCLRTYDMLAWNIISANILITSSLKCLLNSLLNENCFSFKFEPPFIINPTTLFLVLSFDHYQINCISYIFVDHLLPSYHLSSDTFSKSNWCSI